ncbi:hypothetical protein GJ496_005157 [Pomphorhynchus laevis]|nr:hypothetical protein GJ496_005157 [Pomphorhynchus laevis]
MYTNDFSIPDNKRISKLLIEKHIEFINGYGTDHDKDAYIMSDYLRVSGIYWAFTSLQIMKHNRSPDSTIIQTIVNDCFDRKMSGGFRAWVNHEPHLLFTLSSIQILITADKMDLIDDKRVIGEYIKGLQQEDGSFAGDKWGEIDSRFSFCAIACLKLLQLNSDDFINLEKAVDFVKRCQNFDGGFGLKPGSESHAGNIFCCLGFLSLVNRLDVIDDVDQLGWWLCERQLPKSGGLNGRPEKLPDVCYSWWVLSSLCILNRLDWIDKYKLTDFILSSQDDESGGFSDRPGYAPDPFHTLFGLAGLSLMNVLPDDLEQVNPVLCMTQKVVDRLNIKTPVVRF